MRIYLLSLGRGQKFGTDLPRWDACSDSPTGTRASKAYEIETFQASGVNCSNNPNLLHHLARLTVSQESSIPPVLCSGNTEVGRFIHLDVGFCNHCQYLSSVHVKVQIKNVTHQYAHRRRMPTSVRDTGSIYC